MANSVVGMALVGAVAWEGRKRVRWSRSLTRGSRDGWTTGRKFSRSGMRIRADAIAVALCSAAVLFAYMNACSASPRSLERTVASSHACVLSTEGECATGVALARSFVSTRHFARACSCKPDNATASVL